MERQSVAQVQKKAARTNQLQRQDAAVSHSAHSLLALQRSIGNQAVQRLIGSEYFQAKLQISTPGDPFEQEADRVADTVMRMPEQEVSPQPQSVSGQITRLVQRSVPVAVHEDDDDEEKVARRIDRVEADCCDTPLLRRSSDEEKEEEVQAPPVQRQTEEEEEDEDVQAKLWSVQRACKDCEDEMVHREHTHASGASAPAPSLASNIHALNGRGSPLPPDTRAFFEPRFGADFSNVRIHTDSQAAATAKSINARAFTVGPNIAFGASQFAPESPQGKQILAHELTHVIQQGAATGRHQIQRTPEMIQTIPIAGVIPPVTPKQRRHFDHAEDVVDIKNKATFKPGEGLGNYIASLWENRQYDAPVNIKFGSLGSGYIFVNISGIFLSEECLNLPLGLLGPTIRVCKDIAPESQNYNAELQSIPLEIDGLKSDKGTLVLLVEITNGFIHGKLGFIEGKKPGEIHPLSAQESPGLADEGAFLPLIYGDQYDGKNFKSGQYMNELLNGMIMFMSIGQLELANQQILEGKFGLINSLDIWLGELRGKAKGLEEHRIPIERSAEADLFGESTELVLEKKWTDGDKESEDGQYTINGKLRASYRNGAFDFSGSASYASKRIQGEVNIAITTESEAKRLFAEHAPAEKKKGAPEPVELTPEEGAKEPLALTGWGNLHFKLIDTDTPKPTTPGAPTGGTKKLKGLEGDGAFVVSSDGYIILSGKLKLPTQWQFTGIHKYSSADPEADKHLFERSSSVMKFPVSLWGSIDLEIGITVDAEAQLNPLELYEIELTGVYSNHPDYRSEVGLTPHFHISGYAKAIATVSAKATAKLFGLIEVLSVDGNLTATGTAKAYIDAAPTISAIPDASGAAVYAIAGKIYTAGKLTFDISGNIEVKLLRRTIGRTENIEIAKWTAGEFGLQVDLNEYVLGSGAKPKFDYSKIGFSTKERKQLATAVVKEKEGKDVKDRKGGFTQIEDGKEVEKRTSFDSEKEQVHPDLGAEPIDDVIEEDVVMQDQLHELSVTFGGTRDKPTALLEMASDNKEPLDDKIEREKLKVEIVKDFALDEDGKEQLEQRQKDINTIDREAEAVTKNAQQTAQKLPEGEEPVVAGFDRLDDRIASYGKKHDVNDLGEIGPTKKPTIDKTSEARLELAKSTFKDEHWVRQQLQDLLTVKETVAKELIREWRQAGKLFALETHLKDPFKAYNFDQTRAGERPLKDTESNRSKYGFKNPDHDSKAGQAILKKGWRPESPPTSDIKSRYDSMRGGKRAKPPSPYVDFERTLARLGHGPVGASEYWNDTGHTKSYEDNRKWNLNPDHYWGPEHKDESDASGGSSPRYKVPMRAIGSHEDWL